jgi:hypothetical protein
VSITRDEILQKLDILNAPSNEDRRQAVFRKTGVWAETRERAAKNYHTVAPVANQILRMGTDVAHLRRPQKVQRP